MNRARIAAGPALAAGLVALLAACGGGDERPSLEDVVARAWVACLLPASSHPEMQGLLNMESDGKITTAEALKRGCRMSITDVGNGWVMALASGAENALGGVGSAVSVFGDLTGCLGDLDLEMISHTRALDGRVESKDGASSWTYHPDDGLNLVCQR
jgi:hypothetical protein